MTAKCEAYQFTFIVYGEAEEEGGIETGFVVCVVQLKHMISTCDRIVSHCWCVWMEEGGVVPEVMCNVGGALQLLGHVDGAQFPPCAQAAHLANAQKPETELGGAAHGDVNARTWVGLDLATHSMGAADIQNKRGILAGLARN